MFREDLQTHLNRHWIAHGMCTTCKTIWWRRKRWPSTTMVGVHLWMLTTKHLHVALLDPSRPLISFHSQPPEPMKTPPLHHPRSSNFIVPFSSACPRPFRVNNYFLRELISKHSVLNILRKWFNHSGMYQLPRVVLSLVRRIFGCCCTMWKNDQSSILSFWYKSCGYMVYPGMMIPRYWNEHWCHLFLNVNVFQPS